MADSAPSQNMSKSLQVKDIKITGRFVFFWRSAACFSQFYQLKQNAKLFTMTDAVNDEEETYHSTEQWMMAEKARLMNDPASVQRILKAAKPSKCKSLGRKVQNWNKELWLANRETIVLRGNLAKFSQNPGLRKAILDTGDRTLVEASPGDTIWGIGLSKDDNRCNNPETWRGLNLLGKAITKARNIIKTQEEGWTYTGGDIPQLEE